MAATETSGKSWYKRKWVLAAVAALAALLGAFAAIGGLILEGRRDPDSNIVNNVINLADRDTPTPTPVEATPTTSAPTPERETVTETVTVTVDGPLPPPTDEAIDDLRVQHQAGSTRDDAGKDLYQMNGGTARIEFGWIGLKGGAEVDSGDCQILAFVSGPAGDLPGQRTNDCSAWFPYDESISEAGTYTVTIKEELSGVEGQATFKVIAGTE